jgi:hypothetical protein
MATHRFTRQLAVILRETADTGAQSWRNQVSEAGWVPRPELAAPCSCCHRRALERIAPSAADGGAPVRFCPDCDRLGAPMLTSGQQRASHPSPPAPDAGPGLGQSEQRGEGR